MSINGHIEEIESGLISITGRPISPDLRHDLGKIIGQKGAGLALLPVLWTPPFVATTANFYAAWRTSEPSAATTLLTEISKSAAQAARGWPSHWNRGVCVRSSATQETLNERGAHQSVELAADYDAPMIARAIRQIFCQYRDSGQKGDMAIVLQARVANIAHGHMSNEQRVSKTINHWKWEYEPAKVEGGRFNSQRELAPDASTPLHLTRGRPSDLTKVFRKVGRWCTLLGVGRTHLEWGISSDDLWIFQFDLEDDQPDDGVDPTCLLREGDFRPSGELPKGSPFKLADFNQKTGWKKIDKVADLRDANQSSYPALIHITATEFLRGLNEGRDIAKDLEAFARGRIVCRTDCKAESIEKLNLPRTNTVTSLQAVQFMVETIDQFTNANVPTDDICFILHKFIPAVTAVWAVARHETNVVRVDSLWGLPDGLQYLPHDTFEYNVLGKQQVAERFSYKPAYLQEMTSGKWQVVRVARRMGRSRSLPAPDLAYIANHTSEVSKKLKADVQIMWFCRIPEQTGLPTNIPWFAMTPHKPSVSLASVSPLKRRLVVQSFDDLTQAAALERGEVMLQIDPEDPELFRSNEFLDKIKTIALDKEFPVGLTGSILSHAFYVLEKAGLAVVALNEPTRSRARQKRVFRKLVRDEIPAKITQGGESVTLAEISKEEARAALVAKLFEESFELLAADTPQDVTAELADMLEVVQSLSMATGIEWNDVVKVAADKRNIRGGFEKSVVLMETDAPGWVSKKRQSGSLTIPLKLLGQVRNQNGVHTIPFSALLGDNGQKSLITDNGAGLNVKIGLDGITVTLTARKDDKQIPLGLDE